MGQWFSGVGRTSCEQCREIWGIENTPCGKCWPGVHPYNEPALAVYSHCSNQYIIGPAGPIEISLNIILQVCELMNIPKDEWLEISTRINLITSNLIDQLKTEAEAKAKRNKQRGTK